MTPRVILPVIAAVAALLGCSDPFTVEDLADAAA
jgi:hypothetical protein